MCLTFSDLIAAFPTALEAGDIEDFCSLAQYYASKTPQSFRRVGIENFCSLAQYYASKTPQSFRRVGTEGKEKASI